MIEESQTNPTDTHRASVGGSCDGRANERLVCGDDAVDRCRGRSCEVVVGDTQDIGAHGVVDEKHVWDGTYQLAPLIAVDLGQHAFVGLSHCVGRFDDIQRGVGVDLDDETPRLDGQVVDHDDAGRHVLRDHLHLRAGTDIRTPPALVDRTVSDDGAAVTGVVPGVGTIRLEQVAGHEAGRLLEIPRADRAVRGGVAEEKGVRTLLDGISFSDRGVAGLAGVERAGIVIAVIRSAVVHGAIIATIEIVPRVVGVALGGGGDAADGEKSEKGNKHFAPFF